MAAAAGAVVAVYAALVVVAWRAGWAAVLRTPPGSATVPAVAAGAFVALGAAIVALGLPRTRRRPVVGPAVAGGLVSLIGLIAALENLLHAGLGIDRLLAADRVTRVGPPGRPAPEIAAGLLLGGAAVAVLSAAPSATRAVAGLSAGLVIVVVTAVVELASSSPRLFGTAPVEPVSTAATVGLALVVVAVQLLIADRAGAIHALWGDPSMKSALLRAFVAPLPLIAIGPIVFVARWMNTHPGSDGRIVAGAGTATLAALMAASAVVGRRVGERLGGPIEEMAVQARRIAAGDLETELPRATSRTPTEIEDLAASFEAMRVRLAEVGRQRDEFVAMVAHDLRSPMALIAGAADTLRLRGQELPPRQRDEFLFAISRSVGNLGRMVDDMLQAASLESGDHTLDIGRCDLRELIARAATEGQQTWGRAVTHDLDPRLPAVLADGQRVWQVLTNLLSNAAKYSPEGAAVAVAARVDGEMVRVEISDQGPGIAPQDQPRVWEKFSRLEPSRGGRRPAGTGLGLYICRELVLAQGGRVGLRSAPGRGSTFWFTLPVAGAPAPVRTATSPARRSG